MRHRSKGPSDAASVRIFIPRIMAVPRSGDLDWQSLHEEVAVSTDGWGEEQWSQLRLHDRVAVWLTAEGRRADLTAALVHRSELGPGFVCDGDPLVAQLGYADALTPPLPVWLLKPHERDLALMHQLTGTPTNDGYLVKGHAYIRGLRFDPDRDEVRLWAGGRRVAIQQFDDPAIDAASGDGACSYATSGFRATIKKPGTLTLEVTVAGVTRRSDPLVVSAPPKTAPRVSALQVDGADLVVSGVVGKAGKRATHLQMRGSLHAVTAELSVVGPTFVARLPLAASSSSSLPLPSGDYALELVGEGVAAIATWAGAELPGEVASDVLVIQPTCGLQGLRLTLRSPLPLEVRGRFGQRQLISDVWSRPVQMVDRIVGTCFVGKSSGDSVEPVVRELHRRLPHYEVVWGVSDFSVPSPEGVTPVLLHSREWHESLRDARVLVNNSNFPPYYRHSRNQIYVQTWHGTPLKRIGNDMPSSGLSLSYRASMAREAQSWTALVAQSPWAGERLAKAFGFSGHVWASGYPRNDALVAPAAAAHRLRVRQELGLLNDQTAVLYAPTWRDDAQTPDKRTALVTFLEPDLVGPDRVVLMRGHANTARSRTASNVANTVDVTDHPDLPGLYLAADILVTDYSSVMFDFAVTGKPMVFLAPDLAHYRDSTRGFYFDFEEMAPGPIVNSTEALASVLDDLPAMVAEYEERYATFVDTFASHDDGHATHRVVDEIMQLLLEH